MQTKRKYLGPSWKIKTYNYSIPNKHKQVMNELMDLDEKIYIPLVDVFFMLYHPNPYYTPSYYVQIISEDTQENNDRYINDNRPIDEFNPLDYVW